MFIVKKRAEVARFGLFLLLIGLMAFFFVSRMEQWRLSKAMAGVGQPALNELLSEQPAAQVSDGKDYFAIARMERAVSRDAWRETLREMIDSPSTDAAVKKQAGEEYLAVAKLTSLEAMAENLLRGKGYDEVLVTISEGSAQVVVKAQKLTETQARQIADSVARVTGLKLTQVNVSFRER